MHVSPSDLAAVALAIASIVFAVLAARTSRDIDKIVARQDPRWTPPWHRGRFAVRAQVASWAISAIVFFIAGVLMAAGINVFAFHLFER